MLSVVIEIEKCFILLTVYLYMCVRGIDFASVSTIFCDWILEPL